MYAVLGEPDLLTGLTFSRVLRAFAGFETPTGEDHVARVCAHVIGAASQNDSNPIGCVAIDRDQYRRPSFGWVLDRPQCLKTGPYVEHRSTLRHGGISCWRWHTYSAMSRASPRA